ncbi:DUF4344 domain-containing metallopeptidase [Crocosphaera sp.]|uniref:DUF4344 domain-containing metallopeptidase n=1 Tax=Crocosphaera sp. TaxID=2729996 RepID=UPI002606036F|nr:DUF4344 domain-containing metallopeptidase [Crocosphaera sp.]MDJ0580289.1 DUF4344 domain-containing metallopeptidase [Crocosphaera sp.]
MFKILILTLLSIITPQLSLLPITWVANAQNIKEQTKQQEKSNKVGKLILKSQPSSDPKIKDVIQNIQNIISYLNSSGLVIRENINVFLGNCNQGAYWSSARKEIGLCYEFITKSFNRFKELGYSDDESLKNTINFSIFVFYHELGHGLIDILPLNAVGQEEDTVDEFASVMMYRKYSPNKAADIILSASDYFAFSTSPAWGEHSPGDRRLFHLTCFVFGSNPERYAEIFERRLIVLNNGVRPKDETILRRARLCRNAFLQKTDQWNRLLLPHYATVNDSQTSGSSPNTSTPGVSRKDPEDIW